MPQTDKKSLSSSLGLINVVVLLVLLLFGSSVCLQVYYDLEGDGAVTDNAAKSCLVDFQEQNCNPLQLAGQCVELYLCIQKEKPNGVISRTWTIVTISIKTIKENLALPAVFISVLLLFKIANFMTKKDEPGDDKND